MKYKYYDWFYFLDERQEIVDIENVDVYFKTFFEESIKTWVSLRVEKGKEGDVYYHDVIDLEQIKHYYAANLAGRNSFFVKHQADSVILELYPNFEFSGMTIFNFDENRREIKSTRFNKNYELIDYCETFYGEDDDPIEEKYFFPSLWKIQIEDYS